MPNKFYTGKGDKGDTGFFGTAERHPKSSMRVECLGAVDELGSWVGLCRAKLVTEERPPSGGLSSVTKSKILEEVQQNLFIIQGEFGGADVHLNEKHLAKLEEDIADISKRLPEITSFVLPGASELGAILDITRTIARRVERRVVAYAKDTQLMGAVQGRAREFTLAYLNRLSSLLYVLARHEAAKRGTQEKTPTYE
ncbi:MAG: cob(I)yrinic acid a,c-diamide adenosyltransferase [Candidatus Paceibacterota bacterium]|jgi:cob(I)alamin adenosyltransferase